MVKLISRVGRTSSQYLLIATMTSLLVACGGGGSGDTTEPFGDLDSDNDGTINSEDDDDDGDLILDVEDSFVDRDGDGFDDISGLTEDEANPVVTPIVPGDEDGDGFVDVTASAPCGGEAGQDNGNNINNNTWNDNCLIERTSSGGQFADSLFSVGIQRILFCRGFGTGTSYTAFADGEFGAGSETALKAFQVAENLTDDGIVGPQTWARLYDQLELLDAGTINGTSGGTDTYGFTDGACIDVPMFYQATANNADQSGIDRLGWTLARNEPNQTETLPFSIDSPFPRSKL